MNVNVEWNLTPVPEWGSDEMKDIQERVGFGVLSLVLTAQQLGLEGWPAEEYPREGAVVHIDPMDPEDSIFQRDPNHELFGFDVSEREVRFTVWTEAPSFMGDPAAEVRRKGGECFIDL